PVLAQLRHRDGEEAGDSTGPAPEGQHHRTDMTDGKLAGDRSATPATGSEEVEEICLLLQDELRGRTGPACRNDWQIDSGAGYCHAKNRCARHKQVAFLTSRLYRCAGLNGRKRLRKNRKA